MEFMIFSLVFWVKTQVFVWFSTLVFPFSKMLLKNSISCVVGRSVVFNVEKVSRREPGLYCEMSSFPETKAERLMFGVNGDPAMFLWFHRYSSSLSCMVKEIFCSFPSVLRIRDPVPF
jgi:hypothetical protein